MKRIIQLMAIFILLQNARIMKAQNPYWIIGDKFLWNNFANPLPGSVIPANKSANMHGDQNGNIMFYEIDGLLYDKNGNNFDMINPGPFTFPNGSTMLPEDIGWSETAVIPVPNDCKKFYVVTFVSNKSASLKGNIPIYSKVDYSQVNNGGPVTLNYFPNGYNAIELVSQVPSSYNAFNFSQSQGACWNGALAVSKPRVNENNERFLFISDGTQIIRYRVKQTGIFYDGSVLVYNGSYSDQTRSEMELVEDPINGNYKIAVAFYLPGTGSSVQLYELAYSTGNLIGGSNNVISFSSGVQDYIHGLEFSPNTQWLYINHKATASYPQTLEYVNFANISNRGPIINAILSSYSQSFIESDINGDLYLLNSSSMLKISGSNNPLTATITSNLFTGLAPVHKSSFPINGTTFTDCYLLPDQIDGENYANNFTYNAECCYTYGDFTIDESFIFPTGSYTVNAGSTINGTSGITGLPMSVTFSVTTTIDGDVTVPKGSNITMNGITLKFRPTGTFKINNNSGSGIAGRVTFNTCTLTVMNECEPNAIWQGVRVYGNGNLAQSSWSTTPHGWMKFNNSQIDHAVTGIEIQNGGIAQGITSTLKNNNLGLYMTGFSPSSGTNNSTSFDRCNFITSSGTYISQPWRLAFLLNQKLNVSFYGCSFSNQHVAYNYLYDAVYASNSKLSFFDKTVSSVTTHCTFENCRYGIFATTTNNSGRTLSCSNAIFNKNATGIYIANNDYCVIKGNSFNVLDNSSAVTYGIGLYIDNSMGFTVTENNFKNFSLGVANPTLTYGIIANNTNNYRCNCTADNNLIYKNNFNNLHQGIQTVNTNRFSQLPAYDGGLKMECNIFSQTIVWSDIGVYSGGINYHQGYNDYAAGNQFSRTPSGLDYYLHSANPPTQYLWHNAITNGQPLVYSSNNFTPAQITSNSNTCASGGSQRMILNSREYVKTQTLRYQEIIQQLKANNSKGNNNNTSRNVEDMYATYNEIANLKREIVSTFLNDSTEGSLDSALFYINLFDYFESKNGKLVGSNLALGKSNDASIAKAKVSNSEPGSNYDKLMDLQLQLEGKELKTEFTMDPSKITLLNNIANDVSDHESRLIALAYLNSIMEYPYQPEVLVPEFANNTNQRLEYSDKVVNELAINKLSVAPNPFNESTEISANIGDNKNDAQLLISEMTGKIIVKYKLKPGENKVKFENNKSVKGNLICTLMIDGKKIETKIIVALE